MKRFEKDRDAASGTRSGPRARAAQDRKFGAAPRSKPRDVNRADPYQRAARPPRTGAARDNPYGERLRAPASSAGITLDPDVARVFRDAEAVNEALRLVIRLARTLNGSARPAYGRPSAPPASRSSGYTPSSGARPRAPSGAPRGRFDRDQRPRRSPPPAQSEPRFEEPE